MLYELQQRTKAEKELYKGAIAKATKGGDAGRDCGAEGMSTGGAVRW